MGSTPSAGAFMTNKKTVFAIVGPTCTYKTGISIELSKENSFEIISADSRLVYRHMDIGTSKPTVEERGSIPHYMIDVASPGKDYTVGLYKREAEKLIEEIFKRNKTPLFVGGTGLYLNSVLTGLSIPKVEPDEELRKELNKISQQELYSELKEIDPKACEKIHENDTFRTVRALEVIKKTGNLFSDSKKIHPLPFEVKWIGLTFDDRETHTRLFRKRAELFLENGFIDEVKFLLDKYGELKLFRDTIGYKEVIEYLKDEVNKDEMVEKITLSTRQFAKRQRTWFRQNKEINWIYLDDKSIGMALDEAKKLVNCTLTL